MSEKIQPGDLVMVVKPTACCGASNSIGEIHRVAKVERAELWCNVCFADFDGIAADIGDGDYIPLRELKRIPPLDCEDVVVKNEESVA